MTHTLTIIDTAHPGRPPLTMNEYERAHYRKQTAAKRRIQWQIKAALQTTPIPTLNQATVSIIQYAPNKIRRDVDAKTLASRFESSPHHEQHHRRPIPHRRES